MEYGLLGKTLAHSFSPQIHSKIGDYNYSLCELEENEVEDFLKKRDFKGINVTIPYKQTVIPFLDEISPQAKEIGAVNTIVNKDGKLCGYNTDFDGLKALIESIVSDLKGKKVLVLGSGGTSKTACAVAKSLGAKEITVVSRKATDTAITYEDAKKNHKDAEFIINTTPCGMYPNIQGKAIDISGFESLEGLADVVYNPLRTELVLDAKEKNIPAQSGLYMLVMQGIKAAELFIGRKIEEEKAKAVLDEIIKNRENIVLVGMPSCGKSTVGKKLAEDLKREFYDTDELIKEKSGTDIPSIFEKFGEEYFRELEAQVISEVSAITGAVIATGGGAVLREENVKNLKKNSKVIFLDRELSLLTPTADRPTASDKEAMRKKYEQRYGIYSSVSDAKVNASLSVKEVVALVKEEFLK